MNTNYSDSKFRFNHTSRVITESGFASHSHEGFEVLFFKKCKATYSIGGKEYELKRHNLIITRPFDIHAMNIELGSKYDRYNIIFREDEISPSIYNKLPDNVDVINFEGNSTVIGLFEKLDFYLSSLEKDDFSEILRGIIHEILLNVIIEAKNDAAITTEIANPTMQRAVEFIDKNLLTLSGIEEICNELYITKSHLHHLFSEHMNTSPKKYITTKRLALAQREIISGGKPTDVYLRCGFSDYSSFYRAYCKYFGRSPSDKSVIEQGARLKL